MVHCMVEVLRIDGRLLRSILETESGVLERISEELARRQSDLAARLASKGISASPPVDFSVNQAGKVEVAGHPQQAAIEAVLAQDPGLEPTLRDALCLQEQAVGWQKAEQFQQAYGAVWEARGELAAARLLGRFQTLGEPRTTLRFGADGLQARFNGMSGERYVASVMRSLGVEPGLNLNAFA